MVNRDFIVDKLKKLNISHEREMRIVATCILYSFKIFGTYTRTTLPIATLGDIEQESYEIYKFKIVINGKSFLLLVPSHEYDIYDVIAFKV